MEGLGGLISLLLWGLFALAGALKKKQEQEQQAQAQGGGAPAPTGPPRMPESPLQVVRRRTAAALRSLGDARSLAPSAGHPELEEVVRQAHDEAVSLNGRAQAASGDEDAGYGELAQLQLESELAQQRANLLLRLIRNRVDPSTRELVIPLGKAVAAAVPATPGRPLVLMGQAHERGNQLLAGTGLLPLVLTGDPRHRPAAVGTLVEDAWASVLLAEPEQSEAAMARAGELGSDADPMERFASGLAVAWAPALLVDAACTLALGGGHAARVQALAATQRPDELFVVRLDAEQRVEGVPPTGLRLMLLRGLLESLGGPATPPLPPNPVLHLRGPGIWDQVPLRPVLERGQGVLEDFARELRSRDGLDDTRLLEERAERLLEGPAEGPAARAPSGRELLTALGLAAGRIDGAQHAARLLAAEQAAPLAMPLASTAARARPHRRRPASASRKQVLREAFLIGEAFTGRRS